MGGGKNEFELISWLCSRLSASRQVLVGPGDDCAVLQVGGVRQLVTIDSMVEGVHFKLEWFTPNRLGARALAVNLSDIAAMGGEPTACVVALALRKNLPERYTERLLLGLNRAAKQARIDIVGGNITLAGELSITVAMFGIARRGILLRKAARSGDGIFVTGTLGDAALGLKILAGELSASKAAERFLVERYLSPSPRVDVGLRLCELEPSAAAIDLSDGLTGDLMHVLRASRVAAEIDAAQLPLSEAYKAVVGSDPRYALSGGDDYELLFCMPPRFSASLLSRKLGITVTQIGRIIGGRPRLKIKNLPTGLSAEQLKSWEHSLN